MRSERQRQPEEQDRSGQNELAGGTLVRDEAHRAATVFYRSSETSVYVGEIFSSPAAAALSMLSAEGRLDFEVERELGKGGMGEVYLVRSRSSGQRFAVKRAKVRDATGRRALVDELQTWIDLPEHPHLVPCRFFQTVGDDVLIFAEYLEGGSLADWIRGGKLTDLVQMLDLARHIAWGLYAIHRVGLVHQDIKPGNILLTPDGRIAKVADFGLARARSVGGGTVGGGMAASLLASLGGMTPVYCSPEQASGQRLSWRTDVWSWGLTVLEMFQGEVAWRAGPEAPQALKNYRARGPTDPRLPAMPTDLYGLLRRCFSEEPNERPEGMIEVSRCVGWIRGIAERVRSGVQTATDGSFGGSRIPAEFDATRELAKARPDNRREIYGQELDPRGCLVAALAEDGRDPAEVDALLPITPTTSRGQAITDLATYQQALVIYSRLVASGRHDLMPILAKLCTDEAVAHMTLGDFSAADLMCDRALAHCAAFSGMEDKETRTAIGLRQIIKEIRAHIQSGYWTGLTSGYLTEAYISRLRRI